MKLRKIFVTIIGFTILVIGILLLVLPGPAFIVIPFGLAILAIEYDWAKRIFEKVKKHLRKNT